MAGELPFVGRLDELGALHAWLDEAIEVGPRVLLLDGEAGVGKTQLLAHFVDDLSTRRADITVLRGTCHEGHGVPYLPLATALRPAGDLSALLVPQRDDDAPDDADERRLRLFLGAAELLQHAAETTPVVLIIDDLHWADHGTLDLLGHLLQSLSQAEATDEGRVMVVLAHRPVTAADPSSPLLDRVRREPWHRELAVAGLDSFTLHDLVEALTGHRASRQLLNRLEEASAGNPMLVRALLRRLDSLGALSVQGRHLQYRGGEELLAGPRELDELLRHRSNALSPQCRELLTIAAFLGEGESLAELRAIARTEKATFETLIDEATAAGVLVEDDCITFDHPQLRQVLYHRPRGKRRQELHLRIADHLESLEPTRERVIAIAHHLRRAGPAAEADRIVGCCVRAANEAAAMVAWAEAARCYDAAIEATEQGQDNAPSAFLALLHARAAHAHWYNFDNERALRHALAAVDIARATGDLQLWAEALERAAEATWSGEGAGFGAAFDLALYHEFLQIAGERVPALRARVHLLLATFEFQSTHVGEAENNLNAARALCPSDDSRLLAHLEYLIGSVQVATENAAEALPHLERSRDLANEIGDELQQLWSMRGMALARWITGDLTAAASLADESCAAAPRVTSWAEFAYAHAVASGVAVAQGGFEDAEQRGAMAERLLRWAPHTPVMQLLYAALASGRSRQGDFEGAHAALDQWEAVDGRGVNRLRILVRVMAGEPVDSPPPSRRPAPAAPVIFELPSLAAAIEIGDALDDLDRIAWAAPGIERLCERGVRFSLGWCFFLPRLAGVAAARLGRDEEARAWFDVAARDAAESGATFEAGQIERDRQRLLVTAAR